MLIVLIATVLLAALGCGAVYLNNNRAEHPNVNGLRLTGFEYSAGGGMNGEHTSMYYILQEDGTVLYSKDEARWWGERPKVNEALMDRLLLDELEAVFRKNHLEKWHNKTFTKEIVYDGASYGYWFRFDDTTVHFSSQIYPEKYEKVLDEVWAVLNKYQDSGERLPGLVMEDLPEEEADRLYMEQTHPEDGKLQVYITGYQRKYLNYRISNGKTEPEEISLNAVLYKTEQGAQTEIFRKEKEYPATVYPNDCYESSIELPAWLSAGSYELCFTDADLRVCFEIE